MQSGAYSKGSDNMVNKQNLKVPTSEEARKYGRNGGIKSGEARREKKSMQELAKIILNMSIKNGEVHTVEDMQSIAEVNGKNITVEQAILIKQVEKALRGDLRSAEFVRDTAGEKPTEKIEQTGELNNNITVTMNGGVEEWGK